MAFICHPSLLSVTYISLFYQDKYEYNETYRCIRLHGLDRRDGETVSIRDVVRGKPAVISFWGVTCKPCITELNALNEVMEEWLEDVDFDIIAVSVDDSRFSSRARSMAQGYDWQFKCVFDKNQDLKRAMNVSLTPQTFIVDASGNIVYSHSGYTPGSEYELYDKLMEISE